jgi:hypothetical protein
VKILAVGDCAGSLEWLDREVIPYALETGCTRIVQLGDFSFVWSTDRAEAERVLWRLEDRLAAAGITLHFLPGNQENHAQLNTLSVGAPRSPEAHICLTPHVLYTHRMSAWIWDGVRIAAVGGATSIDRAHRTYGVSWWPEEELTANEVTAACHIGKVDLLLTHDAPSGVPMSLVPDLRSTAHRANMTLIGRALKPTLWLHGHYHASLRYLFEHETGVSTVRGLNQQWTPRAESMLVVDLAAIARHRTPPERLADSHA